MACPGFEGNQDFYGLGIRLGVYLQWLSSWISNSLNPSTARTNHTPNSIFVLALLVSMTVSVQSQEIKPVEVYIMILICLGFSLTVMSSLGIRLYFLRPSSLSHFLKTFREQVPKVVKSVSDTYQESTTSLRQLLSLNESMHTKKELLKQFIRDGPQVYVASTRPITTLDDISFLKHWSFSWSGVLWRSAILCYLTGLSLWLWWSPWISEQERCEPTIYFFGRKTLGHAMITFYKVASIIAASPIAWLTLFLLSHALPILAGLYYTAFGIAPPADVLEQFVREVMPSLNDTRTEPFLEIRGLIRLFRVIQMIVEHKNPQGAFHDFGSFIARGEGVGQEHADLIPHAKLLCGLFHAVVLTVMACFITFIEQTIAAANITGVYRIRSTGQLIPFTIGLVSCAGTITEISRTFWLKRQNKMYQHPDSALELAKCNGTLSEDDAARYCLASSM